MTLKEIIERKEEFVNMSFCEVMNIFTNNGIEFDVNDDLMTEKIELEFHNFDDVDDSLLLCLFNIVLTDEVVNDEDKYEEVRELIEEGDYESAEEFIKYSFLIISDEDDNHIVDWKDYGLTDKEYNSL